MLDARPAPRRAALVHGDERITYAELRDRVDRLAQGLAERGVGPGDPVALVLPNVPAFAVTFLAIARLGRRRTAQPGVQGARARVSTSARPASRRDRGRALDRRRLRIVSPTATCRRRDRGASVGRGRRPARVRRPPRRRRTRTRSSSTPPDPPAGPKRVPRTHRHLRVEADSYVAAAGHRRDDVVFCTIPLFHTYGIGCCLLAAVRARRDAGALRRRQPVPAPARPRTPACSSASARRLPGGPIHLPPAGGGSRGGATSRRCASASRPPTRSRARPSTRSTPLRRADPPALRLHRGRRGHREPRRRPGGHRRVGRSPARGRRDPGRGRDGGPARRRAESARSSSGARR